MILLLLLLLLLLPGELLCCSYRQSCPWKGPRHIADQLIDLILSCDADLLLGESAGGNGSAGFRAIGLIISRTLIS